MIVDLAEMRGWLKVNDDVPDAIITTVSLAAQAKVSHWIGRSIYARSEDMPTPGTPGYDEHQIVADEGIRVAIMREAYLMHNHPGGEGNGGEDAVPNWSIRGSLAGYRVMFREE